MGTSATRHLTLLRAHGLLRKGPKTHRYLPTGESASHLITALRTAHQADLDQLNQLAA